MLFGPKKAKRDKPLFELSGQAEKTDSHELSALAHNLKAYQRYTREKQTFLYAMLSRKKKIVFDVVPLLLNIPAERLLPCQDACLASPHGIYGYVPDERAHAALAAAFASASAPPPAHPQAHLDPKLPIRCLSLIGSLGSIAQTPKSDFDYWICLDDAAADPAGLEMLTEKLRHIEQWAMAYAAAEVHFFPMTVKAVAENNFGVVDAERSGTAQGMLLKEEFYRSMTLVAGQTPAFWMMPPGIDNQEYQRLLSLLGATRLMSADEVVDLGHVHRIEASEYYGAAIWQINKTIGSPFKSVLKLAVLEHYLAGGLERAHIADELKGRLQSREGDLSRLDSYMLMFDRAAEFLSQAGRAADLELLRRSIYLKSGVRITLADYRAKRLDRKKRVMLDYVNGWGWSHSQVEELNSFGQWSFRAVREFNREINRFIIASYKTISQALAQGPGQKPRHAISQRDLKILGRKLYAFYSRRTNKVPSIYSVVDEQPPLKTVTIQYLLDEAKKPVWRVYNKFLSRDAVLEGKGGPYLLLSSPFLHEILVWMVRNEIYSQETSINLNQPLNNLPGYTSTPEVQALLNELTAFFPPSSPQRLDEEDLLKPPAIRKVFLVINLETSDTDRGIKSSTLSYLNSWGEIFFVGFGSDQGVHIARDFIRKRFRYNPVGARQMLKVVLPDRQFSRRLGERLNRFFGFRVA